MGDGTGSIIEGVSIIDKKQIKDDRGMVLHFLKADSPEFKKFGEAYFSIINPDVIKGWKKHLEMDQNMAVPIGSVQFVLFDYRENSKTLGTLMEVTLGANNYKLLHIPKGLWYAFKNLDSRPSLIANCATQIHDPQEVKLLPLVNALIPYSFK